MDYIELINYRCFSKLNIDFRRKVNLLIGDNSSGKTTLIRALSSVLNSFFCGYSDENTRFFGLTKEDFTINQIGSSLSNENPIIVNFGIEGIEGSLQLHSKKGRTLQRPLENIAKWSRQFQVELFDDKKQKHALPLFAGFSTSDIHSSRKISIEPFKQYLHKPSFGYFECLQGDGLLPYWTKRLLVLKEAGMGHMELEGVSVAIANALGPQGCNIINGMDIRHNQGKVYYKLTDGREVDTDNLSDGYKRLLNIVIDIAFRCMLLNQSYHKQNACFRTKGTVLIDEIDLHLHPSLQAKIIFGLSYAFPKLQFIITTHAPMVMTGVQLDENNTIYKLNYSRDSGYTATPVELYGLDASTIIQVALHTIPRSSDVDERLKTLFNFIDTDEYVKAIEELRYMRGKFGDNIPELSRAEAMLNFLNPE